MKTQQKLILTITMLLTLVISTIPLWQKIWLVGYDPAFHIARIHYLANNLALKHFPNPIGFNYLNTLGYGVGFFYSNFFIYPFALLVTWGIPLIPVYLIMILIVSMSAIISITFSVHTLFHNWLSDILAAPIYLLSAYFNTAIYQRAAIGEAWALIFVPLVILSLEQLRQNNTKYWFILTLSVLGVLFSHILTFILVCIYSIFFVMFSLFFNSHKLNFLFTIMKSAFWTCCLSAFFIFPFIQQRLAQKYVSTAKASDGTYQIIHIYDSLHSVCTAILVLFIICIFLHLLNKNHIQQRFLNQILVIILLFFVIMHIPQVILILVKFCHPIVVFQTVGRFNTIVLPLQTIFISAILGLSCQSLTINKRIIMLVGCLLIIISYFIIFPLNDNQQFACQQPSRKVNQLINDYSISMGEYLPIKFSTWCQTLNYQPTAHYIAHINDYRIISNTPSSLEIVSAPSKIQQKKEIPRLSYIGYQYQINHRRIQKAQLGPHGLIQINLPPHQHHLKIKIYYHSTRMALYGMLISEVSFLILLVNLFRVRPKGQHDIKYLTKFNKGKNNAKKVY